MTRLQADKDICLRPAQFVRILAHFKRAFVPPVMTEWAHDEKRPLWHCRIESSGRTACNCEITARGNTACTPEERDNSKPIASIEEIIPTAASMMTVLLIVLKNKKHAKQQQRRQQNGIIIVIGQNAVGHHQKKRDEKLDSARNEYSGQPHEPGRPCHRQGPEHDGVYTRASSVRDPFQ